MGDLKASRLDGQIVLITGAASGIGRETALRAASEGADIAAIGLDGSALDSLVDEVRATGRRAQARLADVSDADALTTAIDELAGELGPLNVAHANAGILLPPTSITDLDLDEWNRVLAVDLTGVMLTFRAALPHFGAGEAYCSRPVHRSPSVRASGSCPTSRRRPVCMPSPGAWRSSSRREASG